MQNRTRTAGNPGSERRNFTAANRRADDYRPPRTGSTARTSSSARRPTGSTARPSSSARRPTGSTARPSGSARRPAGSAPVRTRSGSRQSSPQPPRRRRKFSLFAFIALVCVVAAAVYVIRLFSIVGIGEPRFVGNVTVNGISFTGCTYEEGMAQAAALEEEWLQTVYILRYQDRTWQFTRSMINADIDYEIQVQSAWNLGHVGNIFQRKSRLEALAVSPIDLSPTITYDEDLLNAFIDQICSEIDVDAVDAVVVPDVTAPVVITESQMGLKVNRDQFLQQLIDLIEGDDGDTAIPVETVTPSISSDSVNFQTIASFSTNTDTRGSSSLTNIRLALGAFNGMEILPGQRVSFNSVVGPRDEAHGFKQAAEYAGDTTTTGWGGGVCQASTTLYNALVMANMTIVERSPHTMVVSYVDPSCDAAVFYGSKDLVFENNTEYPIYIYTSVDRQLATVTIYGHRPEYFYHLESVIVEKGIESTRKVYVEDNSGNYVYYEDDAPVLATKGKDGCISEGWIVAYDWDTQLEVSRTQVSRDSYSPGASVYYKGVHSHSQVGQITDY